MNIVFRRALVGDKWTWLHLVQRLMDIILTQDTNVLRRNLPTSGVKSIYVDMMNDNLLFRQKYIWKLKVPLKIKIFKWYLFRGVVLTKDNLAKCNWNGSNNCWCCDEDEKIMHLFLSGRFAGLLWRTVHFAFNFPPYTSIPNIFSTWLRGVDKNLRAQIRVGVSAPCWIISNCRNDIVFNKVRNSNFL